MAIGGYYMLYYNYWWLLYYKLFFDILCYNIIGVATLTLGSWPKQGFTRLRAKREARESQFVLSKVQKSLREWTFTLLFEEFFTWKSLTPKMGVHIY
jgi:hypothetical protein